MELTRRNFLFGTAAVGGALALGSLTACAPSSSQEPAGEQDAEQKAPREVSETLSADVVICGAGTAGTCATLRAAELGLKVVTLEGGAVAGGSSRYAEGVFGVESRLCKELGVTTTPQEIFNAAADYGHFASNGPVLRAYLNNAGATIDWLMDHGIPFARLLALGGSPAVWHTFDTGMLAGENLIDPLIEKAVALGAEIRYGVKADELLMDGGKATGVLATASDGKTIQVDAPVVLLCCGGYSDNAEMFEEFVNMPIDRFFNNGAPGRNGEGISMGRSANAALHLPGAVMFNGGRVKDTDSWYAPVNLAFYRQYNFRVNENGVRYWNESRVGDFTAHGNSIVSQKKNVSIIDQAYLDILTNEGLFYGTATMGYPTGAPVPEMPAEIAANPNVVVADTLEEIAEAFGIDPAALNAEVERYNGFCETGVDLDYGKPADYLQPVSTPPYYAAELIPSYFSTVGGLKVDPEMRVVDEDGRAIDGLYACGSDAGGVYGHCYDVAAASGSQQGWAATSGRLAAEHAANVYLA